MEENTNAANLLARVAEKVSTSGDVVADMVADGLVSQELNNRAKTIRKIVDSVIGFKSELKKLNRADIEEAFDAAGRIVSPATFSKNRIKTLRELQEKIDKFNNAVKKALVDNDWESANKLGG